MRAVYLMLLLPVALMFMMPLEAQIHDSMATVIIEVEIDRETPSIKLSWDNWFEATYYQVARRENYSGPFSALALLPGDSTHFLDSTVETEKIYEYRVTRFINDEVGTGFIATGIEKAPRHYQGRLLILVVESLAEEIKPDLMDYCLEVNKSGWVVDVIEVNESDGVGEVKDHIVNHYGLHTDLRSVLLLGNIPVPYSGDMAPDGHVPDHRGAWPADTYYGDMTGNWTDSYVNIAVADRPENHNLPGDGKFDQNVVFSQLELEVGRVDMSRLPAFDAPEAELTLQYLRKNISYRRGEIPTQMRGIVQNNFGNFPEGFGQSGLKNFGNLLGPDAVEYGNYRAALTNEPWLWSYGCGPGSYTHASGIINVNQLASDSLQTIFTMLFGSYFGDWDNSNNLLRGALASGTVLTNVWAGRPAFVFHSMGMGESVGFSVRKTQNAFTGVYFSNFARSTNLALMGDPTLNMYPIGAVADLSLTEKEDCIELSWDYDGADLRPFYLYKKSSGSQLYTLINEEPITEKSYCDPCLRVDSVYQYMIREVKLVESSGGSFYHLAQGTVESILSSIDNHSLADFTVEIEEGTVYFENWSEKADQFFWDFGDGNSSTQESPIHTYRETGTFTVSLIAVNECFSDTIEMEVSVIISSVHEESAFKFSVFPIPFSSEFNIEGGSEQEIKEAILSDVLGRTILHLFPKTSQKQLVVEVPGNLSPGVYFLTVKTDEGMGVRTLIKGSSP
nr:T9SS type A sorting domain-containing protein [Saprospiraceae bacterium]